MKIKLLVLLIFSYFKLVGQELSVFIASVDNEKPLNVKLEFKNISEETFYLAKHYLIVDFSFSFIDSNIKYYLPRSDIFIPFLFDMSEKEWEKYLYNNCYLDGDEDYFKLAPNESYFIEYDLSNAYKGFKKGKKTGVKYKLLMDPDFKSYCPQIFSDTIISNTIYIEPNIDLPSKIE